MEWICLIAIVAIIVYVMCKDNNEATASDVVPNSQEPPEQPNYPEVNPNDPYALCRALACVTTSIPYYRSDTNCLLLITIHQEKHETYISTDIGKYIPDRTNISTFRSLFIPEKVYSLLSKVNFASGNNIFWRVTINHCLGVRRTIEAIEEGINLVNGKPYTCRINQYHPGNDPMQTCIELDAAD